MIELEENGINETELLFLKLLLDSPVKLKPVTVSVFFKPSSKIAREI